MEIVVNEEPAGNEVACQEPPKKRIRGTVPKCARVMQNKDGTHTVRYSPSKAMLMFETDGDDGDLRIPASDTHTRAPDDEHMAMLYMADVEKILLSIKFCRQKRANLVSKHTVPGFVIGSLYPHPINKTGMRDKDSTKVTEATHRYKHLHKALANLMASYDSKFKYTCMQVNEVTYKSKLHTDRANYGPSVIISFGDFTGGGELQYLDMKIDCHHKPAWFYGHLPHRAIPHTGGRRFSVVFFTSTPAGGFTKDKAGEGCDLILSCVEPHQAPLCLSNKRLDEVVKKNRREVEVQNLSSSSSPIGGVCVEHTDEPRIQEDGAVKHTNDDNTLNPDHHPPVSVCESSACCCKVPVNHKRAWPYMGNLETLWLQSHDRKPHNAHECLSFLRELAYDKKVWNPPSLDEAEWESVATHLFYFIS